MKPKPKQIEFMEKTPLSLMYRLGFIVNAYREPLVQEIEQKFGLTRPEWHILMCLSVVGSNSSSEICQITGHPKNSVARGVSLLEKKGHLTRVQDQQDARIRKLKMSESGAALYKQIEPVLFTQEARLVEALVEEDLTGFVKQLDSLVKKFDTDNRDT